MGIVPRYGMPVHEVRKAKTVFVSKRGQGIGYSGIENPLLSKGDTRMLCGDAKASVEEPPKRVTQQRSPYASETIH